MKYLIKLNVVSILYALVLFIPIQLMGNVYRISRLTDWNIGTVNKLSCIAIVAVVIIGVTSHFFLTKKWMKSQKANFWTVILWVPYFILLVNIAGYLFPITNEGDAPNPSTGLIAIGALIAYPFYILIINLISYTSDKTTKV